MAAWRGKVVEAPQASVPVNPCYSEVIWDTTHVDVWSLSKLGHRNYGQDLGNHSSLGNLCSIPVVKTMFSDPASSQKATVLIAFVDKKKDRDSTNGQSADRTKLSDSTNVYSIVWSLDCRAKNS